MHRFTAEFTTRKTYQDTNKVCTTRKRYQ